MFDDGSDAVGDLLIGSDGVHSAVRTMIDPQAPAPRYVGLLNFGGYTAGVQHGEPGAWHMIFGARAFFGYVADAAGGTVWFANVPRQRDDPRRTGRDRRRRNGSGGWSSCSQDDQGPAAGLIASGELQFGADNTHDLPSVPVWHKSPVIIIGDAAHAPSPSSGQGASMAIEDAVVLAQCLRDVPGIGQAFSTFERLRRRRVERIVAQGARSSSSKAAGPIGRVLRDRALPLVFRYLVTERSMSWLYEHHVEWDRPVTADQRVA